MLQGNKIKFSSLVLPGILFFTTLVIYIHHLSASVYGGDSGDFLSAIAVKGIPHPSGYPLYTMIGIVFNALPFHQTIAWKVDLFSALIASSTVVVMYLLVKRLVNSTLIAVISAYTLAFIYSFWLFAEVSEVIALHNFFLLFLFYQGVLFYQQKSRKYLYSIAYTLGLALTNNELVLLIVPSLLILIITVRKDIPITLKHIGMCIGIFLLGLLPYLYIPIAASFNPPVNWDHANTLTHFFQLVTRADYGWQAVRGSNASFIRYLSLERYIFYWQSQLPTILSMCLIIGFIWLCKEKKITILFSVFTAFLLFGPFFILYSATVTTTSFLFGIQEKFYTSSLLFFLLLFPFGIVYIRNLLLDLLGYISPVMKQRSAYPLFFTAIFFVVPIFLFNFNVQKTDLHTVFIGDKLGYDILTELPTNSYLVLGGDNTTFNTLYMHYAQGIRKDVQVPMTDDILTLIAAHKKQVTQSTHTIVGFLTSLSQITKNPLIFATVNDYPGFIQRRETRIIPYGLVEKLTSPQDKKMDSKEYIQLQHKLFTAFSTSPYPMPRANTVSRDLLIAEIPEVYAVAYANVGYYLLDYYQDMPHAKDYFTQSIAIYPSDIAYEGMGDYYSNKRDCTNARDAYTIATGINAGNKRSYHKLYTILTTCLHDTKGATQIRDYYVHFFHEHI